jgi:hypothetical protein
LALKNCSDCHHEVSSKAKFCPNCGAPISAEISGCSTMIVLTLVVALIYLTTMGDEEEARDAVIADDYWVTSDRLNRRTCPSTECGIVGQLMHREMVTVSEVRGEWGRISDYYDASCSNSRSEYVDSGNANCTAENGIISGEFAEWTSMLYLSRQRPADPGAGASGVAALVSGSDDYRTYKDAFIKAAQGLIQREQCTEADFTGFGGWVKSTNYRDRPVYFIYCGRMHIDNRIYLDASTGQFIE